MKILTALILLTISFVNIAGEIELDVPGQTEPISLTSCYFDWQFTSDVYAKDYYHFLCKEDGQLSNFTDPTAPSVLSINNWTLDCVIEDFLFDSQQNFLLRGYCQDNQSPVAISK